jgi:amphi-Trp domain-containing protein
LIQFNTFAAVCPSMNDDDDEREATADAHRDEEREASSHEAGEEEHEDEYEVEAVSRTEAAAVLHAVADGVLAGAVRVGEADDAVAVDVPESVSMEVELEADDDEVELEVELEWPAPEEESAASPLDEHPDAEEPGAAALEGEAPDSVGAITDEPGAGADDATGEDAEPDAEEAAATAEQPVPVGAVEPVESLAGFEVFADRAGEWRWRLRHRNGNIIATGGEGYTRKHNAWRGLRSVMRNAPGATVTEAVGDGENE